MNLHRDLQSEKSRLERLSAIRTGQHAFFASILSFPRDDQLTLQIKLPIQSDVNIRILHQREETQTLVLKLHKVSESVCVAWKLYALRADEKSDENKEEASDHAIEVRYLKIFMDLVARCICPHFLLPVGQCILSRAELQHILPETFDAERFVSLLTEFCDCTLTSLVYETVLSDYCLRGLVFQALFTLAVLQDIFKSFRHNDTHLPNWLILHLAAKSSHAVRYRFHEKNFILRLDLCPERIILTDFHYASMNSQDAGEMKLLVPRNKGLFTSASTQPTRSEPNCYFDVHKLLDSLELLLRHKKCKTRATEAFFRFLDDAVPLQFKCQSKGRSAVLSDLWQTQWTSARQLLDHDIFAMFRENASDAILVAEYMHPRVLWLRFVSFFEKKNFVFERGKKGAEINTKKQEKEKWSNVKKNCDARPLGALVRLVSPNLTRCIVPLLPL
jgi:hypothetical protein